MGIKEKQFKVQLCEFLIFVCFTPTIIGRDIIIRYYLSDFIDNKSYWLLPSTLAVSYVIRQLLVLILHYGVKKYSRCCIIFWLIYYAFETIDVTFSALVLIRIYPFQDFMQRDMRVVFMVMIFVDIGVHILSFVVISGFLETLNRKRKLIGPVEQKSSSTVKTTHGRDQYGM